MNSLYRPSTPAAPAAIDLSDSLDIRLIVAGRLSPTGVALRRDRAALPAFLGGNEGARTSATTNPERNAR